MKEVEVKIIEIDQKKVETKLKSLGAMKILDEDEETLFFDFPDHSISKAKNLLRLRRIGNKTALTFKKFVESESAKIRDEYEMSVSDFGTAKMILKILGLNVTLQMEKHRISYSLSGDVNVDIDKYTGQHSHIPALLEIEASDASLIHKYAKLLGFEAEQCKSWTTFDLIDYYSSKQAK